MRCHVCGKQAVGQCQDCWKFYCAGHGDVFCDECKPAAMNARDQAPKFDRWPVARSTARVRLSDSEAGELPEEPPIMRGDVLERVVSVAQTQTHGGTELTVASLELYEDGFIVNYQVRARKEEEEPEPGWRVLVSFPDVHFQITDDRGSQYVGFPSGGGGGGRRWRGEANFTPRIGRGVQSLNLRVKEIQWIAHGPGQRSRVQAGPWEFVVPLGETTS